jgi:hypothetical protein
MSNDNVNFLDYILYHEDVDQIGWVVTDIKPLQNKVRVTIEHASSKRKKLVYVGYRNVADEIYVKGLSDMLKYIRFENKLKG